MKLIKGDCLKIIKEFDNNSIDTIFADLPFYQDNQDEINNKKYSGLKAQEKKIENYKIWNKKISDEFYRVLKDGGNLLILNAPKYILDTAHIYMDKFIFRCQVPLIRRGSLRPAWMLGFRHNILLFLAKGNKKGIWYGATKNHDKTFPTDVWDDIPYQNGFRGKGNMWHPEAVNIEVVERAIKLVAQSGNIVLDPCMGSGTTGVVCKKLGIDFIGIEKEEKYFKIAEARIKSNNKLI